MEGLSERQARDRLRRYGPNAVPDPRAESILRRAARQLRSPLVYLLLGAFVVDIVVWRPTEALAIAVIVLLNTALGVWHEHKAAGALASLRDFAAADVWVVRDGVLRRTPAVDLVLGDVVRLRAGDRVPADGVVGSASDLLVDESALTGESLPVERGATGELSAGSIVIQGTAEIEVTRTGPHSAMGRLASMLTGVRAARTPLERRLQEFGRRVAYGAMAAAAVLVAAGVWLEGWDRAGEVILFAAALAVAVVPEGLPTVLNLTLARGVERMARRRAVVRKLSAVEALGSVTVIATDKTGTLTENSLEVRGLDTADLEGALDAMVLACDPHAATGGSGPLELALVRYAAARGRDAAAMLAGFTRASGRPFDTAWKFMRVTGRHARGHVSYLKGAPEVLLDRSRLSDSERDLWRTRAHAHAAEGHRVLGLARADGEGETGVDWLGLALLGDAPRPEAPDAVRRARAAGIRVLMMTGDHPATAVTIARAVGIEADAVLTGPELRALSREGLVRAVAEVDVFARVDPGDKLALVQALQAAGEVVAVTGDGVNDAPALKCADVGIAMGRRGTDLSRDVADIVLLDDNFATIVAAVEEGRGVYENIQKFVRFLFSTNLGETLVVTVGTAAAVVLDLRDTVGRLLFPLTAVQLLWVNLITDGAPALALGVDRNADLLDRCPRDPAAPLLDSASRRFIVGAAAVASAVALTMMWLLPRGIGVSVEGTRAATFMLVAVAQLLIVYPARGGGTSLPGGRSLHLAVGLSAAALVGAWALPASRAALGLSALTPAAAACAAAGALIIWGATVALGRLVWPPDADGRLNEMTGVKRVSGAPHDCDIRNGLDWKRAPLRTP